MLRPRTRPLTDLVLVGGGHTHIQVLKAFAMAPPTGVRLTLVADTPIAVYSGMVPGFVAGHYERDQLEIDLLPLVRLAGGRFVHARALSVQTDDRRIQLEGRAPVPYDFASFDIGSTVAGLATPGVREYALPTRPIGLFVAKVEAALIDLAKTGVRSAKVLVVGAGAGGVELAFALEQKVTDLGLNPQVELVEAGPEILEGQARSLRRRVLAQARAREISVATGERVVAVEAGIAHIEPTNEERLKDRPFDLLVWVTGAAAQEVFRDSGLPIDQRGFVRVRPTLQIDGHDNLFAVGDCAHLMEAPQTPKAGVYAVRQGPILSANLRRVLAGSDLLDSYRPQRGFLTLLNLGDGSAIGGKWGAVFSGRWVLGLKDLIDRRFMDQFQALDLDGTARREFESLVEMRAEMEMLCGGCAAKLGQTPLTRALERLDQIERPAKDPGTQSVELGLEHGDDAACYRAPAGQRIVSSVDQFRAFTDDAYLVGRVGAVNAASDVIAKGVSPAFAQALVALPESASTAEQEEILFQVLAGARRAFDQDEITLVGGHTTTSSELMVGFQVEGFADTDDRLLTIDQLRPGDRLCLTKPLGTGVVFHADMKGRLKGRWFEEAIASMLRSNSSAAKAAKAAGARAATDITGFGLAGHLAGMLRASGVAATLSVESLPALAGSVELLSTGLRSTFHQENARLARAMEVEPNARQHPKYPLLFDPQTSGGLLFGISSEHLDETLGALAEDGNTAVAIGVVTPAEERGSRLRIRTTD